MVDDGFLYLILHSILISVAGTVFSYCITFLMNIDTFVNPSNVSICGISARLFLFLRFDFSMALSLMITFAVVSWWYTMIIAVFKIVMYVGVLMYIKLKK